MHVVKRRHHGEFFRQQHAVTEHVTGHVTDTDHGHGVFLHINALLAEVPLHAHPTAFSGDAHAFVVVTG